MSDDQSDKIVTFGDVGWTINMTTDMSSMDTDALFRAMGGERPFTAAAPLTVKIPGKRYWWKPWRRRPDKVIYFPRVELEQGEGLFSFIARNHQAGHDAWLNDTLINED